MHCCLYILEYGMYSFTTGRDFFFSFKFWLTEVSSNFLFRTNWNVGEAAKVWESNLVPKRGIKNPSRHLLFLRCCLKTRGSLRACMLGDKTNWVVLLHVQYLLAAGLSLQWWQEGSVPLIALPALCKHCNSANWVELLLQEILKSADTW